jgi:hypothetical protein
MIIAPNAGEVSKQSPTIEWAMVWNLVMIASSLLSLYKSVALQCCGMVYSVNR